MRLQQFLEHHGIQRNPFAEEDAQTDPVFKEHCIDSTYHPTWDKIFGDPTEPATSIVFGEKGAGKTAIRLQIVRHLADYNRRHPNQRVFYIEYDDFNPFLDRFQERIGRWRSGQSLAYWKLWDHMDAILSLGVTRLVDRILNRPGKGAARDAAADAAAATFEGPIEPGLLSRYQARDLLLLAALYDRSSDETFERRWRRLRRAVRFSAWRTWWPLAVGVLLTATIFGLIGLLPRWDWLASPWPYVFAAAGWLPWLYRLVRAYFRGAACRKHLRSLPTETGRLTKAFLHFTAAELAGQPLPTRDRTDDRFELFNKFQTVLKTLGYTGIVILVDRVDEPHLINGRPEAMKALVWSMLDNKFLKHPGLGFKLLLPIELSYYVDREESEFYQRARLDKQNLIPSLEWTGEALYDVANARLKACARDGAAPTLRSLFDDAVSDRRLLEALRSLRVPRHLFKFLYRTFVAHANSYTDDAPEWRISAGTFESVLAVYQKDQDAFDRGLGAG